MGDLDASLDNGWLLIGGDGVGMSSQDSPQACVKSSCVTFTRTKCASGGKVMLSSKNDYRWNKSDVGNVLSTENGNMRSLK